MHRKAGMVSASMMCADLIHIRQTVEAFEANNVEYLHIDVMDGSFVPNFGLGVDYLRGLRELTDIPMDIHLMVTRPEDKLAWMNLTPRDRVSIHFESTVHVQRTIEAAKRYGGKVMLAINPATPIYSVEEMVEYIDGVTILTVNPGFAGQSIVRSCIKKTGKMRKLLDELGYPDLEIEVDGNISFENAKILRDLGADIFVAGTSSIFGGGYTEVGERTAMLRSVIA